MHGTSEEVFTSKLRVPDKVQMGDSNTLPFDLETLIMTLTIAVPWGHGGEPLPLYPDHQKGLST